MDNIIESNDFSVTYGSNIKALRKITFTMIRGEILGIVGESGSGKSTLGLGIAGLLGLNKSARADGKIKVLGIDIVDQRQEELSRIRGTGIFLIFQDPFQSLDPLVSVEKALSEAVEIRNIRNNEEMYPSEIREQIVDALRKVNFSSPETILKKFPHQLSGGQNQRIMIAMAILERPELLIADEPTTALDVTTQAQVLSLLKNIVKEEKMSMLLITHDLAVASMLCDRIIVLYDGLIQEIGNKDEIIGNPLHPYTRGLINSIPAISKREGKLKFIKGIYFHNEVEMGCPFYPRCDYRKEACLKGIPALLKVNGRMVRCIQYGEEYEL